MATFQKNLSASTAPAIGTSGGAARQVTTQSGTAQAINALSGFADVAFKLLERSDKKDAFKTTQDAGFKLIAEHDSGTIDDITFRRKKKELAIKQFQAHEDNGSDVADALTATFGANPVARQETTEATFTESMILEGAKVVPNGTAEQQLNAGIRAEQDKIVAQKDALAIKAAVASKVATDNEQVQLAGRSVASLAENLNVVSQAAIDMAGDVNTPAQEAEFFGQVTQLGNQVLADFRRVALKNLQGLGSKGFEEGNKRIEAVEKSFRAVFDPKIGVRGVQSKLEFLKVVKANTELQLIDAAPLVNRLHTLIGSQALSVIVASMTAGKVEFGAAVRTQLEGLLAEQGVEGPERTKALSLLEIMAVNRDPDRAADLLISKEKRTTALGVSLDMMNDITVNKDSTKADKDTYTRQYAAALNLATRFVRSPENRGRFLDTILSEAHVNKLARLNDTDPDKAGILGRGNMRFSIGAVREAFNEGSRIKYDSQSGQAVFAPTKAQATDAGDFAVGFDDALTETGEERQIRENVNKALDSLATFKVYDPRLKSMSDTAVRDMVVSTIGQVVSKDVLVEGTQYQTDFTRTSKEQEAGTRSVVAPSATEREKDRIRSPFEQKRELFGSIAEQARANINRPGAAVETPRRKFKVVKGKLVEVK